MKTLFTFLYLIIEYIINCLINNAVLKMYMVNKNGEKNPFVKKKIWSLSMTAERSVKNDLMI